MMSSPALTNCLQGMAGMDMDAKVVEAAEAALKSLETNNADNSP